MNQSQAAKIVLADSFKFYLMTHGMHWNVEGMFFASLHELFGNIYEEVFGSVDVIAEHIRAMDQYAPYTLTRMQELSRVRDYTGEPDAKRFLEHLLKETNTVLESIYQAKQAAVNEGNEGFANYLDERQAAFKKHAWMLRASLKNS
jgi:starvation-inducible DNA-binding protein